MIKAYASYFVSYLLHELKDVSPIKNIILFGSVVRGDAQKDSDVDIFIEVWEKKRNLEEKIRNIVDRFYKSREALLFKARGIDHTLHIIVGKFSDSPKIKEGIEAHGIVLYGQYVAQHVQGKKYFVLFWDRIEKNRGAFLNKLYGFRVRGRIYKGLVELFGGKRLGKSSIMIPVERKGDIHLLLKKYGVHATVFEIYA